MNFTDLDSVFTLGHRAGTHAQQFSGRNFSSRNGYSSSGGGGRHYQRGELFEHLVRQASGPRKLVRFGPPCEALVHLFGGLVREFELLNLGT
jgi:hypothetical protein